jgi:hypothetical protein
MNKQNQKKYQAYLKQKSKVDKLWIKKSSLSDKHDDAVAQYEKALKKVAAQFTPKIDKAFNAMAAVRDEAMELETELKEIRKGFMAQDNPDRKELINLILE